MRQLIGMQTARVRLVRKGTFSKAGRRTELVRAMPRQRKSRGKAQQITRINNKKSTKVETNNNQRLCIGKTW